VLGLTMTAGRQGAMIFDGVGVTADGAELAFEWADPRVGWMPKSPAAIALWNTYMFHSGEDGEAMFTIHK